MKIALCSYLIIKYLEHLMDQEIYFCGFVSVECIQDSISIIISRSSTFLFKLMRPHFKHHLSVFVSLPSWLFHARYFCLLFLLAIACQLTYCYGTEYTPSVRSIFEQS